MSYTVRSGDPALSISGSGTGWRTYAQNDLSPILTCALQCFMEHGYHGTTIRRVAARCGLSVPGLYHHYPSKHSLLVAITSHAMADLWTRSEQALTEAGPSLSDQFDFLVECVVLFHSRRTGLAFIAFSEIRSLDTSARAQHIAARDRQQALMYAVVEQGAKSGVFATPFPREASLAVITMCTGVAQWFRPDGALTPEQLVERIREITRMAVGK
ncbi:TetR/AcrR family transcriptional regulator [Arthrobacter sunyaminii]|uniref:TetR/AcrR family transcriptional regulator n=1 Tax=Arthrobacter sunyaminii TaxID=2816859 RepID=A0A975S6S0_9MICC|nr:TetR family transcriptional regulator [Arthrobacter sunyaminii]QWQ36836.1 TetR/AcrR family transcriptional regulator [Arthrobacter sunyaminii]